MTVVNVVSATKARLGNFGSGMLELIGNIVMFQVEKGFFKKNKLTLREIPITDIESIKRDGNELSITWKGRTDTFITEEAKSAESLYEKMNEALQEQKKILDSEEAANQKRSELANTLNTAMDIVDSLFDVLRSLNGRVDWNRVEGYLKRSEENARRFTEQGSSTINLDFNKLSSVLTAHRSQELSKETYIILKSIYEYYSGLTSQNELPEQMHPNYQEAKNAIQAYYILNDIILGTVVGDEEIRKENDGLLMLLDDLSKRTGLEMTIKAFEDILDRLILDKASETIIEESRALFRQQLKGLLTA
jgi:hypothetical protein